jgi:hypothetical protein
MKENIVGLNGCVMNYSVRKSEKTFILIVENLFYILMIIQAHTFVCGTDVYINRQTSHLKKLHY